nr:MAG TPA: hypothetical protein [Caudoviricetes sp.]
MATNYSVAISERSKVVVTYDNEWYTAQHFKNGCNRGLEVKQSRSKEEIDKFIEKLREVFNDPS